MTRLKKIEQDISALSKADLRKLSDWLEEYKSDLWDKQIEEDARSGKLDKLLAEARAQVAVGKVRPL